LDVNLKAHQIYVFRDSPIDLPLHLHFSSPLKVKLHDISQWLPTILYILQIKNAEKDVPGGGIPAKCSDVLVLKDDARE
jgi:hypothetical protein